jgi:hypothetical protein
MHTRLSFSSLGSLCTNSSIVYLGSTISLIERSNKVFPLPAGPTGIMIGCAICGRKREIVYISAINFWRSCLMLDLSNSFSLRIRDFLSLLLLSQLGRGNICFLLVLLTPLNIRGLSIKSHPSFVIFIHCAVSSFKS